MSKYSAPGKLMLLGEHAVVYGYPCLVTAIDKRIIVNVLPFNGTDHIVAPMVTNTTFLDAVFRYAEDVWRLPVQTITMIVESSFPNTYGFGSSSAVTVAACQAIAEYYKKQISEKELFRCAYEIVKKVQGTGSGFDVAAAVYGGTLWYKNFGEEIIQCDFLDEETELVVGYTGIKADTTTLVREVAKKRENDQAKVDRIFMAIAELVKQAKQAMVEKNWERFGVYMNYNQDYLRDLGVSSEKLEDLIVAANKAGAYGAKLSGAGGGDCMIALVPRSRAKQVRQALKETGGEVVDVSSNQGGIKMEESV